MEAQQCPAFIADIIRQCKTNSERIAVVDNGGRKSTYGEFFDIVQRSSGYIKAKNIPSGSFIVVCLPNSMEYLAVEYGAWLAGCAVAPVSPLYPKARIDFIASHCESPLIVDENVLGQIRKAEPLEICDTVADIAALFYTSGSTGTPKGVMHTFETISHIDHFKNIAEVSPDDCFGIGAPMSFIAWIFTVPFLRAGACVNLIGREVMTDIKKLQEYYDNETLTCGFVGPSALRQLKLKENKSLRFLITGSERVSNVAPEGNYKIFNIYGMTETAGTAVFYDIKDKSPNTPIGKPIDDFEMKIMGDGEICFRGPLTPGYFKDPERSAALWSGGWLHTGDIGRYLADGNLEYVNRKDWMVKINGQRVETGEIIEVIKDMPGVSNATAKGFTAPDGHQYVVAYYVADENVGDAEVKEFISRKLAPYMIPSYFVKISTLPLNVNGKIDVKSLQSPLDTMINGDREIIPPANDTEKLLCKAFETALGVSPVSVEDDFFMLGGDSIRVMQLQLACPELNLSSSIVYRKKTVRSIAKALEEESSARTSLSNDCSPLSKTQSGIFVESMARRGEAVYNNPFLFKITDPIDVEKLASACETAVLAHPNLFAGIKIDENGQALQFKKDAKDFKVEVENVAEAQFGRIRSGLVQPFDILEDMLFRMKIFKSETAVWLFADFHHIIFDGTSNTILLQDIERAYGNLIIEPEQYSGFDLACDEQKDRNSDFFEECRKWNLDNFCEADQTSLPDPDKFSDNVSFEKFEVATDISEHAFAKAAEKLGVTENVLATGAFGYMLGACSHAKSSAFATIYNGRKSLKTSRTISMLVKTLPVFCKWEINTTVGEYFDAVKRQLVGAMAHDLFSFAEICASTAYDSRVIFSWQDELLERKSLCGCGCEMISLLENATGEPLTVQLYKSNGSLKIRTEYRSNMYSEQYIRKFITCFTTILSSLIMAEKETLTSAIKLVSDAESERIIASGWGPELKVDKDATFVKMFRSRVAENPDSIAVVDENGSMTYSELDNASDALASILLNEGVGQEDFVAVMLPRTSIFPVSYVAAYKSGAAYVPMDYEYPVDRLQYMIEDSQAKVLLTTREIYEKKLSEGRLEAPHIIYVEEFKTDFQVTAGIDNSRPDGLAYMIYTSGTTGKPKGVMIEHHSLVNLVCWYSKACEIGPGSRVAQHASFSFDGSVPDLMTPLCFGAQLHILAASIRKDLAAMNRYFCENRIDSVILTTQLGVTMLRMYDLKLKYMMMGGEKLNGQFKTSVKLYNGYGPTEFTVASSYYPLDTENIPDNIPIGKAVPNTLSAVVDSCGRLLPEGIAGELVLVGAQLSRGYWHRPEITAERFTDCPFIKGEKMYHTGDLVKWDENGNLLFLGRIDTQVKLRGFRIELGEIESNLSKFEGIKSSVVAVKEIAGLQHLCAYYVSDKEIDKDALKSYLASSLTDYMVPTAYIQMDSLPMTPNGKVDVRSLPVPEVKAEEIVPPANELESKLFDIVSEYLKSTDFGVTSNLISMGMTSLGAITLSLQIERKAGMSIPSPKMLECPTIRQWAEYLGESQAEETVGSYEKRSAYPMTDNQTGIYIDWEQHKDSTQYNVPMLFRFKGVDPEMVVGAVRTFVNAHPYLKTHLESVDGQVMQTRDDSLDFDVPVKVLDKAPDKDFFQKLLKPFDLFEGPLFRFSVFSFKDSVWLLSDVHHIIFDGGSEAIFAKEVVDACNGKTISDETFSAFDYSLYYNEWKESEEYGKAEQYFTSLLENTVSGNLPATNAPEGSGSYTITETVARTPVRELCRKAGVTENALFLTAVTEVLHRFSREENIAILTVSSGRSLRALERSCGMFVQTLPVVSHHAKRTSKESLGIMHSQIVDTLARDKFPYTKIVEKTGLKADILLAYQGDVLGGSLSVAGKEVELTGLAPDTAKFPLSINVVPGTEDTELNFEYDRSVYSATDVENYACAVKCLIDNLVRAGVDSMTGDIPCVSDAERKEIIALGSGPQMPVQSGTIVDLFKKVEADFPDDAAVTDSNGTLTYSQLDNASDLLAGILLSKGLRKEDFVSLMLPRTKEFSVSYLAVYKAGGAYVPMDHEYPLERLQYMLEDSKSKFLITTRRLFEQKTADGGLKVQNIIFIDDIDFSLSASEVNNSSPDSLAYMIYTSGTTGKPKGVMLEHHSLVNTITWQSKLTGITRGTRVAEHASFSFDASVLDLMTPLAFGGHLHILSEECRKDPEMMYHYLKDNRIETLGISTQLGMMLLNSYRLPLRMIVMGGEKLTGKYDGSVTVVNGYGPTEFTVCSSYHIVEPERDYDNIPIGKAVPNTLSAVVDQNGHLLPRGVPGELVLAGPQIARGYWNKEEITRKRFVDCPFVDGARMYRTGDLVRWSAEGELLFLGRIDTQVKLRGFRIELGEIESQICNFKDVKSAVAVVKEIAGVQHLCAYFTASSKVDAAALKSHLSSCLTGYMVPDSLLQLDAMPLTPNGKVDHKKLPVPDLSAPVAAAFEKPEGELEEAIAAAFQKALGQTEPMGRNASFFLSGGTSLLVMKVIVALSEQGHKLTYGDVFKYPTPRTLAAFLEGYEAGKGSAPAAVDDTVAPPSRECVTKGEDGYDYSEINKVLQGNRISEIGDIRSLDVNPVGDVLLLGSTGYLGIHVLADLLENSQSKVYCVIRGKKGVTCAGRLKAYLMYYFDRTYSDLLDKRLFVVEGDMTEEGILEKLLEIKVDTVINCAANVKHFAAGDEIEKINLNGTQRLIEYCLKTGSRLIHTSTHSISGQTEEGEPHVMLESELFFGQKMMTKYQTSKFQAERAILEAVANNGLKAKIMRLGNLMPRFNDGEFQINIENNGFMARMRAYYLIGCIASEHLHSALEFAPIDETASAILTLARTPDRFTVFHPFNNHTIYIDDVIAVMRKCGLEVKVTNAEEFNERLDECLKDDALNPYITTLLAYGSHNNYVVNPPSLDFTVNVLNAMDWRWPITGIRYLSDAIEKMMGLEYFEK